MKKYINMYKMDPPKISPCNNEDLEFRILHIENCLLENNIISDREIIKNELEEIRFRDPFMPSIPIFDSGTIQLLKKFIQSKDIKDIGNDLFCCIVIYYVSSVITSKLGIALNYYCLTIEDLEQGIKNNIPLIKFIENILKRQE
jgi:hypothetical protein